MIETAKHGRVLVLTTHSMEEAEALGDVVAIMAQGRLRAAGTSLFLKNTYGSGYQLNLLTAPTNADRVRGGGARSARTQAVAARRRHPDLATLAASAGVQVERVVRDYLPGAEIVGRNAGNVTVGMSSNALKVGCEGSGRAVPGRMSLSVKRHPAMRACDHQLRRTPGWNE